MNIDTSSVIKQYKNPNNLQERRNLHELFGTNRYDWYREVFDQFNISKRAKIIELGCGLGTLWLNNQDRIGVDWDITLTDFSPNMLERAQQALNEVDHDFEYSVSDASELPFNDEEYDVVIANGLLYLVPDLNTALNEIKRILKPGGVLYASTSGSKYMIELEDLLKKTDLLVNKNYTQYSFSLDNGQAILEKYFLDVQLHRRVDGLHVTEAKPLAERILSTSDGLTENQRKDVYDFFNEYFKKNKILDITIDTGIFVAHRGA